MRLSILSKRLLLLLLFCFVTCVQGAQGGSDQSFRQKIIHMHTAFIPIHNEGKSAPITSLCCNENNDIFVSTAGEGVFVIPEGTGEPRQLLEKKDLKQCRVIYQISWQSSSKQLLVGAQTGLYAISYPSGDLTKLSKDSRPVTAIHVEKSGSRVQGFQDGLTTADGTTYSAKDGVEGPVNAIDQDRNGTLWVATDRGLLRDSTGGFQQVHSRDPDLEPQFKDVNAAMQPGKPLISKEKRILILKSILQGFAKRPMFDPSEEMNPVVQEDNRKKLRLVIEDCLEETEKSDANFPLYTATTQGLLSMQPSSSELEMVHDAWSIATVADDQGTAYFLTEAGEILVVGNSVRLLNRYDLRRRLYLRLGAAIYDEVVQTAPDTPHFLCSEEELADFRSLPRENFFKLYFALLWDGAPANELGTPKYALAEGIFNKARQFKGSSLLIDSKYRLWASVHRAGIFCLSSGSALGSLFANTLLRLPQEDNGKKRYRFFLTGEFKAPSMIEEYKEGLTTMLGVLTGKDDTTGELANTGKEDGLYRPCVKIWWGPCSDLNDTDWRRLGTFIGAYTPPIELIQFLQALKYNPYVFIPACGGDDLEALLKKLRETTQNTVEGKETTELPDEVTYDSESKMPPPELIDLVEQTPARDFDLKPLDADESPSEDGAEGD